MRAYDFSPLFRYSVGFDRLQRLMDSALERAEVSYPPYNIESADDNAYRITVAVAGFAEGDLDVTVADDTLSISGKKEDEDKGTAYLHRGIAQRAFQLKFNLADHVKVRDAGLENGVLVVLLEREVPEELKPRKIRIGKSLVGKAKELIGAEPKKAA